MKPRTRRVLAITAAATAAMALASPAGPAAALRTRSTKATTTSTVQISSLDPVSATNGWGPWERNRSNGELAANDGHTITIRGAAFLTGLGVHPASNLRYALSGSQTTFSATLGLDDEASIDPRGSVHFTVWGDGALRYSSPVLTRSSAPLPISVPIKGVKQLSLRVDDAGDGGWYDHADWADARVSTATSGTAPTTTTSTVVAPSTTTTTAAPTTTTAAPTTTTTAAPAVAGSLPFGLSADPAGYGPAKNLPARTPYTGPSTITTPGTVIANVDISGPIVVDAGNVTLRNVAIHAADVGEVLSYGGSSPNFTIEDSVLDGFDASGQPSVYDLIIGWSPNATIRRTELRGGSNGLELSGSFTAEGNYLHHIWQRVGTTDHADGIQSAGGVGPTVVRNNFIDMGRPPAGLWSQTSAIGMWATIGGDLTDTLVTHNVIVPMGGFLFYEGITNGYPNAVSNVRFDENVVLRAGYQKGDYGVWYSSDTNPIHGTHSGNVFSDGVSAD